jgi:hypothetical protein
MRKQTVNGTTVLRGSVADVLKIAAGAGLLSDVLPGEVLAQVSAPAAETAVATPVVETKAPAAGGSRASKYQYSRPSGEAFYARKIKVGDLETTDVEFIRDGIRGGLNMFFVGRPGCGKTAAIEAAIWNWDFSNGMETMLCTGSTVAADFTGVDRPQADGTFLRTDGPLVAAMEGGKGLYVDEIGRVDPKELVVLYSVMDGRDEITIPEDPARGVIKAKPGFFVIASTNPDAPGCIMDDALLSRFASPVNYTTDYGIAVKYLDVPTEVAALARDMAKAVKAGTAYWAPTMRSLIQWRISAKIYGPRAAWHGLVGEAPVEAQPEIEAAIEQATGMKVSGGWEL